MSGARRIFRLACTGGAIAMLVACGGGDAGGGSAPVAVAPTPTPTPSPTPTPTAVISVTSEAIATFAAPWSMTFLPDGRLLVTERTSTFADAGRVSLVTQAGTVFTPLTGLPGNLGVLDVALHPRYAANNLVYLSFVEPGASGEARVGRGAGDASLRPAGLAVAAATLILGADGSARLDNVRVIWRQAPKIVSLPGSGEPGGRIAFSPDGTYLFVTAGDRQEFEPVQDLGTTLGKTIRLFADGTIPPDNPFAGRAGALPEIWTLGHRNAYGLAFDAAGRLWSHEMGPMGGDELNVIEPGGNYGWPNVSNGRNYDGSALTPHTPGDGFVAPAVSWTPVIAPAGMIIYSGDLFGPWKGDAIITGLQSKGLVRVRLNGTTAREEQRIALNARIREVEQGPDGAIWILEDAPTGRLVKLKPVF